MAEICIYIPLEPYLSDWFINLHGGNYPVRLMRGCAESDVLAKALMRQPEGEPIPKPEEGDVAIVIPQFRHRDPVYFNYLPKHGKLALLQVIRHNFDFDMWNDLHRFGYIGSRHDHLIYNFMETRGIALTEANWNAIAKRYQRKRDIYLANLRSAKAKRKKKTKK